MYLLDGGVPLYRTCTSCGVVATALLIHRKMRMTADLVWYLCQPRSWLPPETAVGFAEGCYSHVAYEAWHDPSKAWISDPESMLASEWR